MIRKGVYLLMVAIVLTVMPGCQRSANTVVVHKPKKHYRPYNPRKDKRKKRLKKVRFHGEIPAAPAATGTVLP
jgi:hypothetical protein